MKPVAFDYARAATVMEAVRQLSDDPEAKVLAGGQTLGPLLNLRLVRPNKIIDITRIPELSRVVADGDRIIVGACVTHAAIEDGRFADPTHGLLATVARQLAYRAIRTRGTIGGSLVHADPAADWLAVCLALGAEVMIAGPLGQRRLQLHDFVLGAMTTALRQDELLTGIRIRQLSTQSRTGFAKLCRKTGEFAQAIAVIVDEGGRARLVIAGASIAKPIVLETADLRRSDGRFAATKAVSILLQQGFVEGSYGMNIHQAAIERAFNAAHSR